jgi:hypothetical protein
MPLIEGRSLAAVLDQGKMKPDATVALLLKLCDAIDYAHRLGLLHLDLKPANVLLDARDEPLIADFGLARHMDNNGGVDAQEVSGTPQFMAPEQILIKQYRLTPATDIYALGAILYICLTGQSPHGNGKADDVLRRAVAGRVRAPLELKAKISRDLSAICMKCLELQPGDRYKNAAKLADDLRRVRDGLPVSVRRIGLVERAQRWLRREPRLAVATAIAALALLVGATATAWQWREATAQRDTAIVQRDAADAARKFAIAERTRAEHASALGAWLYAQNSVNWKHDYDLTRHMLQWLRERMPTNEALQATTLTSFATALNAEKHDAASALLLPLVEIMGREYRPRVIAALEKTDAPNRYALAARLAWFDEQHETEPRQYIRLLDLALSQQPDSIDAWNMAATFCTGPRGAIHCQHPEAIEQLIRIEPDNSYPWLLLAMSNHGPRKNMALHEAAQRNRFDDHFRTTFSGYMEAIDRGGVPVPETIAGPMKLLSPQNGSIARRVGWFEQASFPLAAWQPLIELCNPARHALDSASGYQDCLSIGERMATSKASVIARHIGAVIVRRIAKGTPQERKMIKMRRNYEFVMAMRDSLSEAQQTNYPSEKFLADVSSEGEFEAIVNQINYYGLPTESPKDWQPKDPNRLLLPEEQKPVAERRH